MYSFTQQLWQKLHPILPYDRTQTWFTLGPQLKLLSTAGSPALRGGQYVRAYP